MSDLMFIKSRGISKLVRDFALSHRDQLAVFSKEELNEGEQAFVLYLLDSHIAECKEGKCPFNNPGWAENLNKLSIARCLDMKAYHRWYERTENGSKKGDERSDYLSSIDELDHWPSTKCNKTWPPECVSKMIDYYQSHKNAIIDSKAQWRSMSPSNESPKANYETAAGFVERVLHAFEHGINEEQIGNHIREDAPMMSALDYFSLCCKCKATPPTGLRS